MDRCRYCHEDSEGYYVPLDKNGHVFLVDGVLKKYLSISWYGHNMEANIKYCPICGRNLYCEEDNKSYFNELYKMSNKRGFTEVIKK